MHRQPSTFDADHPEVLVGEDNAPTPVEFLLHALAACLTSGIANIAAARGVNLTSVESTVEGDIDLLGILGPVRRGPQRLPGDPHQLPPRGRRARQAAPRRGAVATPVRGLRRAHQRRTRERRGRPRADRRDATSTSWSSGHASPAHRQPCCWRGPAYGSRWSTAARTAATRSRPTALMRAGVLQLHRWGLLDAVVAEGTPAIRRTRFHYAHGETTVVDIRPSRRGPGPVRPAAIPPRPAARRRCRRRRRRRAARA